MQGSHIMHKLIVTSLTLILILGANTAWAIGEPAAMTRTEFDQLMQDISNWGRWGKEDELGTLNLITPEVRKSAAALVTDGVTVSMSLALNKVADPLNANPFHHKLTRSEFAGHQVAGDEYRVDYHGFAHSHMDGLPHFAHKGFFYNGFPFDGAKPGGADKLGIHNAGINGVFTRGVLVDLPRHLGVSFLEPGAAISAADLQAWEEATGRKSCSSRATTTRSVTGTSK